MIREADRRGLLCRGFLPGRIVTPGCPRAHGCAPSTRWLPYRQGPRSRALPEFHGRWLVLAVDADVAVRQKVPGEARARDAAEEGLEVGQHTLSVEYPYAVQRLEVAPVSFWRACA